MPNTLSDLEISEITHEISTALAEIFQLAGIEKCSEDIDNCIIHIHNQLERLKSSE